MEFNDLFKKIDSLGKIEPNLIPKKSQYVRNALSEGMPKAYLAFSEKYGSFCFGKEIVFTLIENIPIADNNQVTIDCFYNSYDSALLAKDYEDQIPSKLVPIFSAEPGDFICVDTSNERIFYWYHEGQVDQSVFFLAETFAEFVLKLEIFDESKEEKDSPKIVNVKISQEFLNLLKKDGYGPKS